MYNMDHFNLLDLDNDVLNIIGDYVKKDNHNRMHKICKRYVKLYQELDKEKESERMKFFEDGVEMRFIDTMRHFVKLRELIKNKYHDCIIQFDVEYCRVNPFFIATVLKDGKQQRFRYF
jgi:hypothetical protein